LTGLAGRWFVPDYSKVAQQFDAVYLTVGGYLSAAGVPLPVDGGWTVLAGWDPGETYWFGNALEAREPAQVYRRETADPLTWTTR
jgi:hypothetical protein